MIVLDGATGTELGRRGVDTRSALFSAAALVSEAGIAALRTVHADYVRAGAQVITANTFRTNPRKAGARWRELTELAVRLPPESRGAGGGSQGPLEGGYPPGLRPPPHRAPFGPPERGPARAGPRCALALGR